MVRFVADGCAGGVRCLKDTVVLGAVRAELGLVVAVVGWTVVFCVVNVGFGAV